MIRAFVDSSVLYASVISSKGAARELLKRHIKHQLTLVVSEFVRIEVKRNLADKVPQKAGVLELLFDLIDFDISNPTSEDVKNAMQYTESKDAPVVAGAIVSQCHYLLTFDRQHLLGNQQIEAHAKLKIITPGTLVQILNDE